MKLSGIVKVGAYSANVSGDARWHSTYAGFCQCTQKKSVLLRRELHKLAVSGSGLIKTAALLPEAKMHKDGVRSVG